MVTIEREADGSTTEYFEIFVAGGHVERLMREVFNDHRGTPSPELARIRRVARAAFFRTEGGSCAPGSWGLRLWNGRGEQMVTVFFPNPHFNDAFGRLPEPRWEKTALWEDLRRRYAA